MTGIPAGMLADQYGMAGLVTYLRAVDNPAIVALALGHDLTTLGLNLNLSECVSFLFASHLADEFHNVFLDAINMPFCSTV